MQKLANNIYIYIYIYMKDYDEDKESSYRKYWDVNNLHNVAKDSS